MPNTLLSETFKSVIPDERVRAVIRRLEAERRRAQAGSPNDDGQSRDPYDYADRGFSIRPDQGDLIYLLCRGMRATRVVEFATSVGMSTPRVFICLALLLAAMHLFARYVAVCQLVLRISLDGPFLPAAFDSKHPAVLRC